MGRQQQLQGVVRRALLRRFHISQSAHCERSTADAALLPLAPSDATKFHSAGAADAGRRSPNDAPLRLFPSAAPRFPAGIALLDGAGLGSRELLAVGCFLPAHLSRSVFRNFSATPAGHASSTVRVGGSMAARRGFASVPEEVRIMEVDEVRGERQGGDEGITASVSGREAPVKKRRRKKGLAQEGNEEWSSTVGGEVKVKDDGVSALVPENVTINAGSCDSVVAAKTPAGRKKRVKEVPSGEEVHGSVVAPVKSSASPKSGRKGSQVEESVCETSNTSSLGSSSVVNASNEPLESVAIRVSARTPTIVSANGGGYGEAVVEFSSSSDNQEKGVSAETLTLVSANEGRSDEAGGTILSHHMNPEANGAADSCMGAGISSKDQESRSTSSTSVVTEHLKELKSQNAGNSTSGPAMNVGIKDGSKQLKTSANQMTEKKTAAPVKVGSRSNIEIPSESVDYTDPMKVYQILQRTRGALHPLQAHDKVRLNSIFYRFSMSGWVSDQALSLYINSKFFPTAASKFRKFFTHRSTQELRSFVIAKGPTNEALKFLFPSFAEFCIQEFSDEICRYRELVTTADMTKPDAWYPFARAMKRKVVYHKGPTNSGKTYIALKRLMEASSGIYCSPLRLLAMEVFDTVNMQGVYCNLHTGQEKRDVPFANHVACTIEMCYLNRQWDVAVIDEIQMMSDEYRGWAWTRAFLGLQADEIHVCGDPSALPLIRNLCNGTGDELVENEYERFKPLKVSEESLKGDFRNIQAGDCIVAFSRRDIFDIKREVELATKHRCCVVYGALPPETRTQQAKLFNEADNGYDVLVASDAIGMGLNLNIRRVVFFSLDKFDGDSKKPVPPAQVKQIAGRAGRRGSIYPEGVTTTFFSQDLAYLDASLVQDFEPSTAAGLFPVYEQVELFASQLPNENFAKLLERFSETCKLDGAYFLCRYDNLKRVANMLEKVKGLSLEDRFNFCFAPVNVRDPQSMGALYRYATAFSQKIPVHVEMGIPSISARDEFELLDLEARHQVLSMYLWLSQHFPGDLFPQKEQAGEMASQIAALLGQSLVQSSRRWSKRKLPATHTRGSRLPSSVGRYRNRPNTPWNKGAQKVADAVVQA